MNLDMTEISNGKSPCHKEEGFIENVDDKREGDNDSMIFVDREINIKEEKLIKKSLLQNILFQEINEEIFRMIIEDLIEFQLEPGRCLYEEGDDGNYFYIIKNGVLEVIVNGFRKGVYKDWDCFGELALIQQCTRTETVNCLTKTEVFILDGISFRQILTNMNNLRIKDRLEHLNMIKSLSSLNSMERHNLATNMEIRKYQAGDVILYEGLNCQRIFIIKEGSISSSYRGKEIGKFFNKASFGESSIFFPELKYSLQLTALENTICFEIARKSFEEALGHDYRDIILLSCFKTYFLQNSFYGKLFEESQLDKLFKYFTLKIYKCEEVVCNTEMLNKKIIVIIEGSLVKERTSDIILNKGDVLSEDTFIPKELPYCIVAFTDCIILESNWKTIVKSLNEVMDNNNPVNIYRRINNLKKVYIFKNLSDPMLISIAKMMKKRKFDQGSVIIQENTNGDEFYMIANGRVRVTYQGTLVRELEEGNCFGEISLINRDLRTASVLAVTKVICYTLNHENFDSIVSNQIIKDLITNKIYMQDTSISLRDLYYIKFLGKGKFGSVNLVHNKKYIYAIKTLNRNEVEKKKILSKYFVMERNIMLLIDHPFIVKLVKSFKNEYYCFLLLEYISGKNLDDYISERKKKKNLHETRFFIASMIIIIEYLHKRNIAHRDIKPSNIMIDSNGYVKLIDFGTAKIIYDLTYTIIGTPHYISPEILLGKGYSMSCDYWSIGVCMYEIFYGFYPFGANANDILEVYKDILHKLFRDLAFPKDDYNHFELKDLINSLLNKRVQNRSCCTKKIKLSNFFIDFDWSDFMEFKIKPPYIPETWDWKKNTGNTLKSFETVINNEITDREKYKIYLSQKTNETDTDYNKRWADEF